jgi:hypothetical protein
LTSLNALTPSWSSFESFCNIWNWMMCYDLFLELLKHPKSKDNAILFFWQFGTSKTEW